jgi:hypothetical protein
MSRQAPEFVIARSEATRQSPATGSEDGGRYASRDDSFIQRGRSPALFFQPTSLSLTDLTVCPRKTALNWTGMFSSS